MNRREDIAAEPRSGADRTRFGPLAWVLAALLLSAGCATAPLTYNGPRADIEALTLVDASRGRVIPIIIYGARAGRSQPLALISNGYGVPHSEYRFLAGALVARGYVVASIRHDLEGDPAMPSGANLAVRRRPFWSAGVESLRYVAAEMRRRKLASAHRLLLVGHSNGGDISMLFADQYPAMVDKVFSLDSRRMPFPRSFPPRLCSARSSDQRADVEVMPNDAEQQRYSMLIETIPGLRHDDMTDHAAPAQRDAMIGLLRRCLSPLQRTGSGER